MGMNKLQEMSSKEIDYEQMFSAPNVTHMVYNRKRFILKGASKLCERGTK